MTDLGQTCWAVVPVKAPGEGKSRLAGALDAEARSRLIEAMLAHVIDAARDCAAISRVCLVTDPAHRSGDAVTIIQDAGGGLNAALEAAVAALPHPLPDRIIVVAADLPQLAPQDFTMLAMVPLDVIAIAPDRHGTGTNALSLPLGAALRFRFLFGQNSHFAHRAEAQRLGYNVETMLSEGLEKDIDEPADLTDAKGCLQEAL